MFCNDLPGEGWRIDRHDLYPVDMKAAATLTEEQRSKLALELAARRDYLGRVRRRMEATHWPTNDAVYNGVLAAYFALHGAINAMSPKDHPAEESKPIAKPKWAGE